MKKKKRYKYFKSSLKKTGEMSIYQHPNGEVLYAKKPPEGFICVASFPTYENVIHRKAI